MRWLGGAYGGMLLGQDAAPAKVCFWRQVRGEGSGVGGCRRHLWSCTGIEDLDIGIEPRWHFPGHSRSRTQPERGWSSPTSIAKGTCYLVENLWTWQYMSAPRLDSTVEG
ncbi:hypothetical protein NDU88_007464 [Pleurodeles waltl]|uniref:Uncharacterized protein n=1 Tax=Pleurodeles waltl TaxID=8319 RepID=A0AAV7N4C7_PLEWA|nr:hypothetical protein NDU88_007464 [Pleurodeles waltl]